VIDGILLKIGVDRNELEQRQRNKREKAGGFKEGIVLLETRNPLPTQKDIEGKDLLFEDISHNAKASERMLDPRAIIELGHKIDEWTDRREHPTSTETLLNLVIPVTRDSWATDTSGKIICGNSEIIVRIQLAGKRLGAKHQIEISLFTPSGEQKQLGLFDDET
jgi:hypothetical protein